MPLSPPSHTPWTAIDALPHLRFHTPTAILAMPNSRYFRCWCYCYLGRGSPSFLAAFEKQPNTILMALETKNGARNLGCGFQRLLIGSGRWGQPCHLSHHFIPALPWYHQWLLHRNLLQLITPEQQRYFADRPLVGYLKLVWHVLRDNHRGLRALLDGQSIPRSAKVS